MVPLLTHEDNECDNGDAKNAHCQRGQQSGGNGIGSNYGHAEQRCSQCHRHQRPDANPVTPSDRSQCFHHLPQYLTAPPASSCNLVASASTKHASLRVRALMPLLSKGCQKSIEIWIRQKSRIVRSLKATPSSLCQHNIAEDTYIFGMVGAR